MPNAFKPVRPPTQYTSVVNFRAYLGTGVYLGLGGTSVLVAGGQFSANAQLVTALTEPRCARPLRPWTLPIHR